MKEACKDVIFKMGIVLINEQRMFVNLAKENYIYEGYTLEKNVYTTILNINVGIVAFLIKVMKKILRYCTKI